MRYVVMLGLLLVLTGCGPSGEQIDTAWKRCVAPSQLWQLEHPDASPEEVTDKLVEFGERCSAEREQLGDAGFVEVYG